MYVKALFSVFAVAGMLLGGAGIARAQEAQQDSTDLTAQAGNTEAQVALNQVLGLSVNAVDVYLLRCTGNFAGQVARAQVRDLGGVDGRRFDVSLTRRATGRTSKATAPDGGTSGIAAVATGGAGSDHFVIVGKDRAGIEPYRVGADCVAGGFVRPHILFFIQNQ
jgi:hypothetical protein